MTPFRPVFVSTDSEFIELARAAGYEVYHGKIEDFDEQDFEEQKKVYVSPANSLGFMDGGIDIALSTKIFPEIDIKVRQVIQEIGRTSSIRRKYFPVASAMFIPCENRLKTAIGMISAPTMLRPQNITSTQNVLRTTQAVRLLLDKLFAEEDIRVVFTSMGCGYGKMSAQESFRQILSGFFDTTTFPQTDVAAENAHEHAIFVHRSYVSAEFQPDTYENSEFFKAYSPPATSLTHLEHLF
jgi:O-acetyl-ADP-ribose deacetylase (regulator of RNase III)